MLSTITGLIMSLMSTQVTFANFTEPTSLTGKSLNQSIATINKLAQDGANRSTMVSERLKRYSFAQKRVCSDDLLKQMELDPNESLKIIVHKNNLELEKFSRSAYYVFSICSDNGCVEIQQDLSKNDREGTLLLSVPNSRWACQIAATNPESRYFRLDIYTEHIFHSWSDLTPSYGSGYNKISFRDLKRNNFVMNIPLAKGGLDIEIGLQ